MTIIEHHEKMAEVTEEELAHFVGKNTDKYLKQFRRFRAAGEYKFVLTWNWAAFFFSFMWLGYRKMYLWALDTFLLIIFVAHAIQVPLDIYVYIVLMPIFGMAGSYIYYRRAKKKILKFKNAGKLSSPHEMSSALKLIGGVNELAALIFTIMGLWILMQALIVLIWWPGG